MDFVAILETRSRPFWLLSGTLVIALVGLIDFLTGDEISVSLFYLFPIFLITWFTGKRFGIAASVLGAFAWFWAEKASDHVYSLSIIYYWNSTIRFGFFIIVTLLLAALKKLLEKEKELARIDNLTGAVNVRCFAESVELEIARSRRYRHPLSIAYLDLDNFKFVNDNFGHSVGDKVLNITAQNARRLLRKMDVVARLGGDEFAILLPETDQPAARAAVAKLQAHLLEEMRKNDWPVTFSIGVLTCLEMPPTTDELIKQADNLMYSVKNAGKDSVNYAVYAG